VIPVACQFDPDPGFLTTVIPVYNGEKYLRYTLNSIANQSRQTNRLVILDNRSTDNTAAIVFDFAKSKPSLRVDYILNDAHVSGYANFNRALGYSNEADYLHIIAADDLIAPDFYAKLTCVLDNLFEERALVYSDLHLINETVEQPPSASKSRLKFKRYSLAQFLQRQSEFKHVYCQSVILKTGRQPSPALFREEYKQVADVIFFAEWAHFGGLSHVTNVTENLCCSRLHPDSATQKNSANTELVIVEEWAAMNHIADLLPFRPLTHLKRLILLAARSQVKMNTAANPIRHCARGLTGGVAWFFGRLAVWLRDFMKQILQVFLWVAAVFALLWVAGIVGNVVMGWL
jgi:glycosyltransferase involved in cell wall biosynthesis